jgi:chromosome segregation ATPase
VDDTVNRVQTVELRDAAGGSLGTFQSEETVRGLAAECDRLRSELAQLRATLLATDQTARALTDERHQLHEEIARLRNERDEYQKAVHFLTQREFAITREDIAEIEKEGLTFDKVIAEVEQVVKEASDA